MNLDSYACAEVLDVLDNMEKKYVEKIPKNFLEVLKENASDNYKKHIVTFKPLKNQNLNKETLKILTVINLKYWTESQEDKDRILKSKIKKN